MLKNIKNITIGFICGASMFSIIPVKAAIEEYILYKADYKIIVNSREFNDPDYPILNYKGTTYMSIRKAAEALGVNLHWNADLGQAEINTVGESVYNNATPSPTHTTPSTNIIGKEENTMPSEIPITIQNNVEYYSLFNISEIHKSKNYNFVYNIEDKAYELTYNNSVNGDTTKTQIILKNIRTTVINNQSYISKKYYEEVLLPLLQ